MSREFVHVHGLRVVTKLPIKNTDDVGFTVLLKIGHNCCVESLNGKDHQRECAIR